MKNYEIILNIEKIPGNDFYFSAQEEPRKLPGPAFITLHLDAYTEIKMKLVEGKRLRNILRFKTKKMNLQCINHRFPECSPHKPSPVVVTINPGIHNYLVSMEKGEFKKIIDWLLFS